MEYRINSARKFRGRWEAGGDKSLTHRAFLFNALAEGEAVISNTSGGDDCARTRIIVEKLGAEVTAEGRHQWRVRGCAGNFKAVDEVFDCGNSGTTMRLVAGLLSSQRHSYELDGDESLRSRPMERIKIPLELLGAKVELAEGGMPPFKIQGGRLKAGEYESPVASAQVKSAFLLGAIRAQGDSAFHEPALSRDHSERILGSMGIEMTQDLDGWLRLSGPQLPKAKNFLVPGDISSSAFLLAAGLLIEGSNVIVKNVGVNPTRTGLLKVVERMGGKIAVYHPREELGEPVADLLSQFSALQGVELMPDEVPSLIDEIPILAALACQAESASEFHGLADLRHKESDRLEGCRLMLEAFGADASIMGDTLRVEGRAGLKGCEFDPKGDHRMAMAASVLALIAKGESRILNTECVATSFPEFPSIVRRMSVNALENVEVTS